MSYFRLSAVMSMLIGAAFPLYAVDGSESSNSHPHNKKMNDTQLTDIEVITVHAQKRQQNIHDVATSIDVFSGTEIEHQQLKDTTQLSSLVPNFKITNNAGEGTTPSFNLRGIGMTDYNSSFISPISIYSDGVVNGGVTSLSSNLYDVEQIEVLKGPQGTLFGRNTTGGAIQIMSRLPEKELGGYLTASIAEHDHQSLDGAFNLPLTDSTQARFAFNHEDYEYAIDNQTPAPLGQQGGLKQTNARLIIKTELDDFLFITKLHAEDWSGAPKPIYSSGIFTTPPNPATNAPGELCPINKVGTRSCLTAFGDSVESNDYWTTEADTGDRKHDTESWGASLNASWFMTPDVTLKSITAYKDFERFHSWDSDGNRNLIEGVLGTDNQFFSQEFNVFIQAENAHWTAGLFYLNDELNQDNSIDLFRDFRGILPVGPGEFFYDNTLETESIAAYSQVDYKLTPNYTLTAGLRYTDESTEYRANSDLDTHDTYIADYWDITGEVENDEFSNKLALVQRLDKNNSIFYSYSRGYKSGGYNAGYASSPDEARASEYDPETVDAFEIGSRLYFTQLNIQLDLAAFYYDYQDQQIFINQTTGPAPFHVVKNADKSHILGLESALTYTPTAHFQLEFNIGWLPEAEIDEYEENGATIKNSDIPFTSEWNVSSLAMYTLQLGQSEIIAQIGFDYQSEFYFDQYENPYTEQDAYTIWNGRIAYVPTEQFEIALWGKNLFNEEYAELLFDSTAALGAITELRGEARQIGLEAKYTF